MPQEERKRRLKSRLGLTLFIVAFELVFVKSSKTCFRVFSIFRNFRMQDSSGEVLQQAAFDGVQQNSLEDHFRVIVNDVNSRAAKSWVSRYHGPMGVFTRRLWMASAAPSVRQSRIKEESSGRFEGYSSTIPSRLRFSDFLLLPGTGPAAWLKLFCMFSTRCWAPISAIKKQENDTYDT